MIHALFWGRSRMFSLRTTAWIYEHGRQIKGKAPATTTPCLQSNDTTCTVFVLSASLLPTQSGLLKEQMIFTSGTDVLIAQLTQQWLRASAAECASATPQQQITQPGTRITGARNRHPDFKPLAVSSSPARGDAALTCRVNGAALQEGGQPIDR